MSSLFRSRATAVATGAAILVGLGSVSAVAAGTIGSRGITDNSIRSVDIKDGEVKKADVSDWISSQLNKSGSDGTDGTNGTDGDDGAAGNDGAKGEPGTDGAAGAQGEPGTDGADGTSATYTGPNWSIVDRNVLGNGESYLRAGPTAPPLGDGSLGIRTGGPDDKSAFGNQVDFGGDLVKDLTTIGFSVYTTGENNARGNNMPSIQFEIDPNRAGSTSNFSTLVYVPANGAGSAWTKFDAVADAENHWGLTGSQFNGEKCSLNGTRCTWAEILTALETGDGSDEATIHSTSISKGRDFAFSGAVDAFEINNEVFDFEPFGVK